MATVDPSQYPTAPLDNLRKLTPGDLLYTVTSSTRSAASVLVVPSFASSQPSRRFTLSRTENNCVSARRLSGITLARSGRNRHRGTCTMNHLLPITVEVK